MLEYEIILSGNDTPILIEAKGGDTISATVAAGRWEVKIDAYITIKDEDKIGGYEPGDRVPFATGTNFADVKAGRNNIVSVPMGPFYFTVSFETDGGTQFEPVKVLPGTDPEEFIVEPDKTGYVFNGWYKDAALTILWDFNADTVTADITIYAKWIPDQIFNFSVGQIIDGAPVLDNITIYRTSGKTTAILTVSDPEQYLRIEWHYNNICLSEDASLILDSSDTRYNMLGPKLLTLEVIKDGIPYSRMITFTVDVTFE